jgi:hypothetical protein
VSGAASKHRPVNSAFMRHQEARYPQLQSLFAEGLLWGFAHLEIVGDEATVRLLSVADSGDWHASEKYSYTFHHRSD